MSQLLPEKGISTYYSRHIDKNTTDHLKIKMSKPAIVVTPHGSASLVWNMNEEKLWQGRYTNAQKYVDSEILRLSEPYVPLQTGQLIQSGILGTDIGSGVVQWIAPYAKAQYYLVRLVGSMTGALRGSYWFQRMKETHVGGIITGARRIAGGKNK